MRSCRSRTTGVGAVATCAGPCPHPEAAPGPRWRGEAAGLPVKAEKSTCQGGRPGSRAVRETGGPSRGVLLSPDSEGPSYLGPNGSGPGHPM